MYIYRLRLMNFEQIDSSKYPEITKVVNLGKYKGHPTIPNGYYFSVMSRKPIKDFQERGMICDPPLDPPIHIFRGCDPDDFVRAEKRTDIFEDAELDETDQGGTKMVINKAGETPKTIHNVSVPDMSWTKKEIQKYLKSNGIEFYVRDSKSKLLTKLK